MLKSRDPKTTASGIALILIGILSWIFGVGFTEIVTAVSNFDAQAITTVVMPFLTGLGLLSAKDNNVERG